MRFLLNLSVLRESFILIFFTYLSSVTIGENVKNLIDKAIGAHGQQSFNHLNPWITARSALSSNRMRSFGGGGEKGGSLAVRHVGS